MRRSEVFAIAIAVLLLSLAACSTSPPPVGVRPAASPDGTPAAGAATAPAATQATPATPATPTTADPQSYARPWEVAVEHLALDLTVDFAGHTLSGRASLRLRHATPATELVLDTRDLDIRRVTLDDGKQEVPFRLGEADAVRGRSLTVPIRADTRWVHVDYSTRPTAEALQWLTPAQAGSQQPFLFSQSEAILARTWIPCQDTPSVRQTYEATVRVPAGFLALMSAENPTTRSVSGVYKFNMPQPIPSYLVALAVGDLAFQAISPRCGVYALPTVLPRAAAELVDLPRMIDAAEKLYGPYRWGRYDIVFLPPSYPYGGMENPRLTFATPTILAGDRSLVSVVAHELAHSWSGNLVTNATWDDFWLNEGFTDYFERRIMELVASKDFADMEAVLGYEDLQAAIQQKGATNPDTQLHLTMAGRDPDEAMGIIAYKKGELFLSTVEASVGRARFDRFLREYFATFAFQSMDTRRFAAYLAAHLLDASPGLAESLRLDEWLYRPGLPATALVPRSTAFARVDQAAAQVAQGASPEQLVTSGWTTLHWLRFLRHLPPSLTSAQMAALDAAFHFTASGNDEILDLWLLLALRHGYSPALPTLDSFLTSVGRLKYVIPLYAELAKTPAGEETALRIYSAARPAYHPVTQGAVDKILDWRP